MSDHPHIENFEIVSLLGKGGMATVWKARQASLDRFVAVKVLSSSFATDPADIHRFREEARAAGRLKHPGIVQVYDANFTNGIYYFVMELVDGYTVGEWIRRKGRLDEADALTVAESVIAALDYAWNSFSIIHCDIKPENIMVDADGTVKTTDLGLARAIVSMQSKEAEQEVLGTPAYMSPEQVTGQPDLDCRADIYALGATMYHMVTGHPLFAGEGTDDELMQKQLVATVPSPTHEVSGLSHGFVLLLAKMLAKDRKYRPQDWKAVLAEIRRVRDRRITTGREPPPGASTIFIEPAESDAVRRRNLQSAGTAAAVPAPESAGAWGARLVLGAVLLIGVGFAAWWFIAGGPHQAREQTGALNGGPLSDDDRYKAALAFVADNPHNLTGGIARLEAMLASAPGSWYAQQARTQRDRLRGELEAALQTIYKDLDSGARDLVARNRLDEALRLLEKYQGEYAAETAAWRQEQAQLLRGHPPPPRPKLTPIVTPPKPVPHPVAPTPPPRPAVVSEEQGLQQVARMLLKDGASIAGRKAADLAARHETLEKGANFAALQKLLAQAAATEQAVLDTFAAENGKEITVGLARGQVKGTVGDVADGRVHLTLSAGGERSFSLEEMDVGERLRRLGRTGDNGAGATVVKALWAHRAFATDRAKTLFSSLPDPLGTTLARAVDEKP
jgi:serine/threonine-protein kinase